jgi:RNase H-fold protein (predicted Holliday junction resolvase)
MTLKKEPKILGLDISTKTIGWALFGIDSKNLLELTHFSPRVSPRPEDKIEELLKKSVAFEEKLKEVKDFNIIKVVI